MIYLGIPVSGGVIFCAGPLTSRARSRCSFLERFPQHVLDVFGENVELDIQDIVRLEPVEVCLSSSMRNDPEDETGGKHFGDR